MAYPRTLYLTGEHRTAPWLTVVTSRVVGRFLDALAASHKWRKVFLISPAISTFGESAGMTFGQLLKRLCDDNATAYVVTRPPIEPWHEDALTQLAETGQASIALVSSLTTKLYVADTDQGALALLGSADLTEKSLSTREIGLLIRSSGTGRELVRRLTDEACELYRSENRQILCTRKL